MMIRNATFVAIITCILAFITAWVAGGIAGAIYALPFAIALVILAFVATVAFYSQRAKGNVRIVLKYAIGVGVILTLLLIGYSFAGRNWTPGGQTPPTSSQVNESLVDLSRHIATASDLTSQQRDILTGEVPAVVSPSTDQETLQAVKKEIARVTENVATFQAATLRQRALTEAQVRAASATRVTTSVGWKEVWLEIVKQRSLRIENQLRAAGFHDFQCEALDDSSYQVVVNPDLQSGPWYLGPFASLTPEAETSGCKGLFKIGIMSRLGQAGQFVFMDKITTESSNPVPACNGQLYHTTVGSMCSSIQWNKDHARVNDTFTVSLNKVAKEWPPALVVRLHNVPPSMSMPICVIPSTMEEYPDHVIDAKIALIMYGTDGQVLAPTVGTPLASLWYGPTSRPLFTPTCCLTTIGELNPTLAIQHNYDQAINLDVIYTPRALR